MIDLLNKRVRLMATSAAVALLMATAPQAYAATPADTLVLGWAFDDIITLDPAEAFEISTAEVTANTYNKLVALDLNDTSNVVGELADSWTVSDDGLTYTFKLKSGLTFASGNPLTAEDVAFSFERAVKLDKSPAFLLTQFGLTGDNVTENAKAADENTFVLTVDKPYAPSFVLNVLTSTVASVVDKKVVMENAKSVTPSDDYKWDTDFGNEFLKTGFAGSGPFKVRDWRANEVIVLERNDKYFGEKAPLARVIYRHMKESAGQRLALENGDIDVARNLEPGDVDAISAKDGLATTSAPKGTIYYFSLNQKNETLAKPEVIEAFKYLVDYDAIGETLIKGIGTIHQTFLPAGQLGALDEKPYSLNVEKAKELLAKAGVPEGFSVTMDVRNTQPVTGIAENVQQTLAQAGIKLEIIPGDGKQTLTKYRARQHDIYIGQWGSDYFDPNSNAETFTYNPDNSDEGTNKTLAWRNAWDPAELSKKTQGALLEKDSEKRAAIYEELQKEVLAKGPFVIIFQQTEVAGYSEKLKNYKLGPSFDTNYVFTVSKD
ncbi:MAG TPA: ABC transporter substrate-binding protein [Pseudorhizobium sp.]|nr:ABC transporter substrate-binding protein [Pseudorhizobium sp.]